MSVKKKALIVITEGSEDMEAVIPIDLLNRAGIEVTVAGLLDANPIRCSRQVRLVPEVSLRQVMDLEFDAILLPGGLRGAANFAQSVELHHVLRRHERAGRIIAAICATPTAFKQHGIGLGKKITSTPLREVIDTMMEGNLYQYVDERVVVDGNLITSQGPGTATEWSLAITEKLLGKQAADAVAKNMLIRR